MLNEDRATLFPSKVRESQNLETLRCGTIPGGRSTAQLPSSIPETGVLAYKVDQHQTVGRQLKSGSEQESHMRARLLCGARKILTTSRSGHTHRVREGKLNISACRYDTKRQHQGIRSTPTDAVSTLVSASRLVILALLWQLFSPVLFLIFSFF